MFVCSSICCLWYKLFIIPCVYMCVAFLWIIKFNPYEINNSFFSLHHGLIQMIKTDPVQTNIFPYVAQNIQFIDMERLEILWCLHKEKQTLYCNFATAAHFEQLEFLLCVFMLNTTLKYTRNFNQMQNKHSVQICVITYIEEIKWPYYNQHRNEILETILVKFSDRFQLT